MNKTAERRRSLKEALIDAAERTISRDGLAALRARDLAREAGCALGAIYNVFPDLDALIYEVNARTLTLFEANVKAIEKQAPEDAGGKPQPAARLLRLAEAYLDFAAAHGARWRALFEHRLAGEGEVPDWYREAQRPLFSLVEAPLAALRPDLDQKQRALLARNVFAAVHGVVSLGLDEKLVSMPLPVLRDQLSQIVGALAAGLMRARIPVGRSERKPSPLVGEGGPSLCEGSDEG